MREVGPDDFKTRNASEEARVFLSPPVPLLCGDRDFWILRLRVGSQAAGSALADPGRDTANT